MNSWANIPAAGSGDTDRTVRSLAGERRMRSPGPFGSLLGHVLDSAPFVGGTPYAGAASVRVNAERSTVMGLGAGIRTASPKLLESAAGIRATPTPLISDPVPNHASGLESLSCGISPRPGFGADERRRLRRTPPRQQASLDVALLIKGLPASRPQRPQLFNVDHNADHRWFAGTAKQLQPSDPLQVDRASKVAAPHSRIYPENPHHWVAGTAKWMWPSDPIGHSQARGSLSPAGLKTEFPSLYRGAGDFISHSPAPRSQARRDWISESRGKHSPAPQRREMLSEDHPPGRCQSTPSISSGFNSYDGGGRVRQRVVRSPSLRSLRGTAYGGASATATSAAESRASTPPPRWRRVGGGPPSPSSSRARTLTPPPTWERQGAAASRTPTTSSNCTSYGAVRSCFPKQSSWSPSDVVSMAGSL
mmetsp:Transcript_11964/g.22902  ORF Transcript_11964/g.22902 Transcript_11964/m.22902 type:complete len:420 (+) Transcript_11964:112-1371(+)